MKLLFWVDVFALQFSNCTLFPPSTHALGLFCLYLLFYLSILMRVFLFFYYCDYLSFKLLLICLPNPTQPNEWAQTPPTSGAHTTPAVGLTNDYLVATNDPLAISHNDQSPLVRHVVTRH